MKTKDKIVFELRRARKPMTVYALAARIKMHHSTVRRHCQELTKQGVLERTEVMGIRNKLPKFSIAKPGAKHEEGG